MWWGTAIEAQDPGALANFYSELLGLSGIQRPPSLPEAGFNLGALLLKSRNPGSPRRPGNAGAIG
jgi:hypothetical protein